MRLTTMRIRSLRSNILPPKEHRSSRVQCPFMPTPTPNGKGAVEALGEFVHFVNAPARNICGSLMVRKTVQILLTCPTRQQPLRSGVTVHK